MKLLVGNIFPTSLIRRSVRIDPVTESDATHYLDIADSVHSFWGHTNTLNTVNKKFGFDFSPKTDRPAVTLDIDGIPVLHGERFETVLVISPDYKPGFRPAIGVEVGEEDIVGWQCLLVRF